MPSEPCPASAALIRWQWAFQDWATGHLLAAAASVSDAALRTPGAIPGGRGDGSTWETLAHIVGAEQQWLARWVGLADVKFKSGRDFNSLDGLRETWDDVCRRRRAWLGGIDEPALGDRPQEEEPLWQTLLHVSNHATHHRAEACASLTAAGSPPAGVDMLEWIDAGCPGAETS